MSKKHKSKRLSKKQAASSSREQISFSALLTASWFPYAVFGFLAILYFIRIFQGNVTFFSSEGGVLAYPRFGWGSPFVSPFNEQGLWFNTYLGGMPGAQGLVEYTHYIIRNILIIIVPENIAVGIYYILLTFATGAGMYLFLTKGLGMRPITGLVIGVAYMFAPANLSLTYAGHLSKMGVYAILPFQFLCTEKGMETGRFRYFLYLGGLIALSIGTAHLQYAYLAMWGIALFGGVKIIRMLRKKVPVKRIVLLGVYLGLAAIIGLGISARAFIPQYMHTKSVSKRSVAAEDKETGKKFAASWSLHPEEIASLVIPEFAGYDLRKQGQHYWGRNPFKINSEYFGIIVVFLAIGGLLLIRKNGYIQFFLFLFLFALLYSLAEHTPLFSLGYNYIPGMKYVRGLSFLALLFTFSAMTLAAFGLNQLFNSSAGKGRTTVSAWKSWKWALAAFVIIGGLAAVAAGPFLGVWKTLLYTGLEGQKAQAMAANQGGVAKGGLWLLFFAGSFMGLIYSFRSGKISAAFLGIVLLLMIILDTWRIDKQFLKWIPSRGLIHPTEQTIPAYEALKERDKSPYRIFPLHAHSKFTYKGANLITGFNDFTLLRYENVLRKIFSDSNKPLIDLLCTKYLMSKGEQKIPGFPQVYGENDWYIYLNPQAYPYMYFSTQWKVEPDKDNVFEMLAAGRHNGVRIPIIEKEPPEGFLPVDSIEDDSTKRTLKFLNQDDYYGENLTENIFEVNQPQPGLLVFSENYHSSWHAFIDGEEAPVYQVNYLWRGVFVPAGKHRIEFHYKSEMIMTTRMISFLFIIGYIAAMGVIVAPPLLRK